MSLRLLRLMSSTTPLPPPPPPPKAEFNAFSEMSLWEKVQSSLTQLVPSWRPSSDILLREAEKRILDEEIKSSYTDHYVSSGNNVIIRTVVMEPEEETSDIILREGVERTPLVMVHGFGSGFLQFYRNLDHLHAHRRLYALDLPGFGRSSRITFGNNPEKVENQFVDVIEKWREEMGIDRFVLLGHSLGGFLTTSYAIKHPERVRHLILVDPWGFPPPPDQKYFDEHFSSFQKISWPVVSHLRPFTAVRAAGPWGLDLVKRTRKDLTKTFGDHFMEYVYHCNARNSTGEDAYYYMQHYFGWARRPMLSRLNSLLDPRIPITVISGGKSWLDAVHKHRGGETKTADLIKEARPKGSYVAVEMVEGAGHHLHAEKPHEFNRIVREVLEQVDSGKDEGGMN